MKVRKDFFCIQTKTVYKKGDEYKGKRTDIVKYLIDPSKKVKAQD